jgi:hypothetical protein
MNQPNMCTCNNCRWEGKVSECETEVESEG